MLQWVRISVAGVGMIAMTLVAAAPAAAQTREGFLAALGVLLASSPTDPSPPAGGAGISARDQKLARLLYQAQRPDAPAPRLTLEQITARKARGESWGDVLKDMKARGLVSERSLLQALVQAGGNGVVRTVGADGKPAARAAVVSPRDDETGDGQKLKP